MKRNELLHIHSGRFSLFVPPEDASRTSGLAEREVAEDPFSARTWKDRQVDSKVLAALSAYSILLPPHVRSSSTPEIILLGQCRSYTGVLKDIFWGRKQFPRQSLA